MPINFLADINTPSIELAELPGNGTETITLKAPDAVTSSVTYTFPEAPGTDGFVLSSLTDGTMSWVAGGSGGTNIGTDDLTITDTTRTLTMASGSGYKFSILNSSTAPAQEWYRNASSIWTNLKIESTAGTAGKVSFLEANNQGTHSIALKAPNSVTSDITYELPEAPTASNKVLTSTTGGVMSWADQEKDYENTIVTNSVNLVPRLGTWTSGQWLLRGSVNKPWTYFEWTPFTGTFNIANGWPTDEVTMAGVKIGSLPITSGTPINLSATITAKSSSVGGGSVTGRVYVFQYRCSTIAADSGNHTSVQVQSDYTAFSIPDTDTAQGTCVSMDFTLGLNMAVGDYYLVAVNALTSSGMNQDDPVWFSYNITQTESVT
jgi:hypothetical protein